MNVRIGSAPDNWGVWFPDDSNQTPWHRFLDEMVEAEYEWTELGPYGYLPTDLPTLQSELDLKTLHHGRRWKGKCLVQANRWRSSVLNISC